MGRRKIVDMGASAHNKPTAVDIYADIKTHLFGSQSDEAALRNAALEARRRIGKSATFGMLYGGRTESMRISDAHPMRYRSGFKYLGRQKELGGAYLYRTNNRVMGEILTQGALIPHTTIYYHRTQALAPTLPIAQRGMPAEPEPTVVVVAWCRRHTLCELTDALATLHMMGMDEVAVVRSFEP